MHVLRLSIKTCSFWCYFSDCKPLTHANDTLTVTWPTDVTYAAAVTDIPNVVRQKITQRLIKESNFPILNLVVPTNNPP